MKKVLKPLLSIFTAFTLLLIATTSSVKAAAPDNKTVEGEGNHFVTGQSYPSAITVVGYDVINDKYYLNFTLTTTKTTPTDVNYFIDIFKDDGNRIGNIGDYENPEPAPMTTASLTITNKVVTLSEDLTAKYSLIITVKSVETTP